MSTVGGDKREPYEAPKLSPMVPRDVFCPTCAAPPGVRCLTSTGKRVHGPHNGRILAFEGLRNEAIAKGQAS